MQVKDQYLSPQKYHAILNSRGNSLVGIYYGAYWECGINVLTKHVSFKLHSGHPTLTAAQRWVRNHITGLDTDKDWLRFQWQAPMELPLDA